MEDTEKIKQRYELLKMAKELLNEDYINRRAEDHNRWVSENEELWRTTRRNLPYPPFAKYPTDDEIVRAAANLYDFIYGGHNCTSPEIAVDVVERPVTATPVSAHMVSPPPPTEAITAPTESVVAETPTEPVIAETPVETVVAETPTEPVVAEIATATTAVDTYSPPTAKEVKELGALVTAKALLPGWVRRSI
jgi:hypothetical protein